MVSRVKAESMNPTALYIGVDVHEKESQVAVYEKGGELLQERKLPTKRLPKFISSLQCSEKHVGIESVGFIYPIYDALVNTGCDVAVANPDNIQLIARTRIKHDKVDARVLGELLRANFFPRSHIPDVEIREKRLLTRDRVRYAVKRAELKNSIKWFLKRRGIAVKRPLSVQGRERIRSLGLPELDYRLRELELVESVVDDLDRRIVYVASKDRSAGLIDTIPGVGAYTALFLSSALDDVNRFHDSKHACAYLGLVPSLHQSGEVSYSGHITRRGNKWLRRNLVECARWSVRKDPHMQRFFLRVSRRRGKKKAHVAVARKIVSYAYWMLKRNLTYEELAPWKNDRGQTPKFE
jgi:transposase